MIIYDEIKKNTKIAVLNNFEDILDKVKNVLEDEEFNYEIYSDIDKLLTKVVKGRVKILVILKLDKNIIEKINENSSNICIIVIKNNEHIDYKSLKRINIQNIVSLDGLENELNYALRIVSQSDKIDYQKFKLEIVGNLVESISHQIQANLLLISASLDVIKVITSDEKTKKNKEKEEVLNSLYSKNNLSLQKSNMLLELMSDVTNVSSESIIQSEEICDIITIILDEYIKEKQVDFRISLKLKEKAYICGPLNDIIFLLCKIIREIIDYDIKNIILNMWEDEDKWYFEVICQEDIDIKEKIVAIKRYVTYIKDIGARIKDNRFIIYIKKSK